MKPFSSSPFTLVSVRLRWTLGVVALAGALILVVVLTLLFLRREEEQLRTKPAPEVAIPILRAGALEAFARRVVP